MDLGLHKLFFWTWFRVLLHAVIHLSTCISARGNSHFHVYFRMWKSLKNRVFPHVFPAEIHKSACKLTYIDLHILLCISACGNSLKIMQIRVRRNTLFLMWEFTFNYVSPHAVIHQNLCKSAQRIYTFSVDFHKWKFTIISVYPQMRKIKF